MAKETPTKKKTKKGVAGSSSAKAKAKNVNAAAKVKSEKPAVTAAADKPVKAVKSAPVKADANTPTGKLARWYKWLGFVLFVEGLAVVLLSKSVTAPITLQYPAVDTLASESNGHRMIGLASRHLADVHMGWVVATFLIVFATVSLMMATLYRKYLDVAAERGVNVFRSLAMGLGGGLMVAAIALVSGISSLAMLVTLFGATLFGALLGLGAEVLVARNGGVKPRLAHFLCGLGIVSALFPWVVFAANVLGANLWSGDIPSYLYSIYACQFVLFGSVLLATHYRLKRQGKWADALYTDRGFLLLSFIAATLLAAQIFVGVLK
jgi:hypothetical protein